MLGAIVSLFKKENLMRKIRLIFCFWCGLLIMHPQSFAQWIQTGLQLKAPDGTGEYFQSLAVKNNNIFVGTYYHGVFVSTDNGSVWTPVDSGLTNLCIYSLFVNDKYLFAGTQAGGVFRSTNNGKLWTPINGLMGYSVSCFIAVTNEGGGSNLFAGTYGGVFLSSDEGTNWVAVNSGIKNLDVFCLVNVGANLFAGVDLYNPHVNYDKVYLSTNSGTSWTSVNSGLPDTYITSLAAIGNNIFAGTFDFGIYLSTNNGTSWTSVQPGSTNPYIGPLLVNNTKLFAGTNVGTSDVLLTSDSGAHWTDVAEGLLSSGVYSLVVCDTYLFAGTCGGLWRRPLSEMVTSVKEENSNFPTHYSLQQNYPNPFNPSTTISFTLPSKSHVTLKVFDIMGREIAILVNGEMFAGNHTQKWNPSNISSGIYFYRLEAGSYTETKKLVLLR